MSDTKPLADKYIEFIEEEMQVIKPRKAPTWDDFFDWADVPKKDRTDFACAAITKQVNERIR